MRILAPVAGPQPELSWGCAGAFRRGSKSGLI